MEYTDLQRLKKVVKWLIFSGFGENEKELAELLGYKKSSFSQILNGRVPLSDKFLDKICSLDNNINKVWVLENKGEMLKNPPVPEPAPQESHAGADRYTASLEKQIALLEKNNALQERENTYLLERIKNLQKVEKEAQTPCDEIKIIAEERASIIDLQKDKIEMQNKIIEDLELKLQKFKKEEKSIEKHSETPTLLEI